MTLAYDQQGAAQTLSMSVNHFKVHVRPHLPVIYVGGLRRWAATDIQKWLDMCSVRD